MFYISRNKFYSFFLILLSIGSFVVGMGEINLSDGPSSRLSFSDKKILRLVKKEFPIDIKTFRNTTPIPSYTYWVKDIRRYQAMDKNWIISDPPGDPYSFYVTPENEIFQNFTEALTAIHYVPKNDEEALRIGIIIAGEDSNEEAQVIIEDNTVIEGIPKSVLSGVHSAPMVTGNGHFYTVTVYSYVSRNNVNHFVHAYHTVWQHIITIDGYTYIDTINSIWEKR